MKKILVLLGVIGILALVVGGVSLAYAQAAAWPPGSGTGASAGPAGLGTRMAVDGSSADAAGRGGPPADMPRSDEELGPLHELMTDELAGALGLTPEEFQARIANGESFMQIGLELGFGQEELRQLMYQAHERARARAVEEGLLDQEQFEWMHQHRQQVPFDGEAPGPGAGPGPETPPQPGPYGDPENCPGEGTGPHGPGGRGRNGG